jgi:hypothetical protein
MTKTRAYRQRARKYLDEARKLPAGERRTNLVELAQLWHHLAQEEERGTFGNRDRRSPPARSAPAQQQQQIQPKKVEKEK